MALQAATGLADISPRGSVYLAGYPHTERISSGIHDPLQAVALCLANNDTRVLMLAVDTLFLTPATARELRREIAEKTGTPADNVFISCTHTHSAPPVADMLAWREDPSVAPVDTGYLAHFKAGIIAAAVAATHAMRPAELAWTTADADGIGGNRLGPDGPMDPEVGVLAVRDSGTGELLAISAICGMHPTVLHEDSTLVSADFPGYTRAALREAFSAGLAVLYHLGPCGNLSPRRCVQAQTFEEAERLGRLLARRIAATISAIPTERFRRDITLRVVAGTVPLPARTMPAVDQAEKRLRRARATYRRLKREHAARAEIRTAECAVFGAEEGLCLARCRVDGALEAVIDTHLPATVQVLRIGDRCLAGMPGELFVEYGLELKRRTNGSAFAVSLVNGELQGYIVTPEAARAGGYEADSRLFEPQSGAILVDAAVRLIEQMQGRQSQEPNMGRWTQRPTR